MSEKAGGGTGVNFSTPSLSSTFIALGSRRMGSSLSEDAKFL